MKVEIDIEDLSFLIAGFSMDRFVGSDAQYNFEEKRYEEIKKNYERYYEL